MVQLNKNNKSYLKINYEKFDDDVDFTTVVKVQSSSSLDEELTSFIFPEVGGELLTDSGDSAQIIFDNIFDITEVTI